jgi:hypothetical protein
MAGRGVVRIVALLRGEDLHDEPTVAGSYTANSQLETEQSRRA